MACLLRGDVLFLLSALAFSTSTRDLPAQPEEHPGKAPYERACRPCHGSEGKGASAPSLVPFVWDDEAFLRIVREGGGEMPPTTSERLSDEDVKHIAEYLRLIAGPR